MRSMYAFFISPLGWSKHVYYFAQENNSINHYGIEYNMVVIIGQYQVVTIFWNYETYRTPTINISFWQIFYIMFVYFFQDPLMRRIEGAPIVPAGALLRNDIPLIRRRNRIMEWVHNFQFRAKKIDVISRVLFPGTFTIFNIMYWSYYLTQKQQSSDKK